MGTTREEPEAAAFVFRPRTGLAACVLWAILGVVWLALAAATSWLNALSQVPAVVLVSTIVYAICGRPRVVVGPRQVLLRNVIRDVTIPYSRITALDTKYALTITTSDGRRHQAWAAPAGGRLGAARVTEEERKSLTWSGPIRDIPASAALRSDAGATAAAIRRRWTPSGDPEAGLTDGPALVDIRWATGLLVIIGGSALATLVIALS